PALEQGAAETADFLANSGFGHCSGLGSIINSPCLTLWQRGQAVIPRGNAAGLDGGQRETFGEYRMPESAKPRMAVIGLGSMGFGMATRSEEHTSELQSPD